MSNSNLTTIDETGIGHLQKRALVVGVGGAISAPSAWCCIPGT